jgi:enoyl-[acyl-carrier protein] reductase II
MGKNRICELLGIQYPIIQAPMNWVSGAELVAAVSKAGGLGTLGPNAGSEGIASDVELTGERVRAQIREIKSLTDAPFAVNVVAGFGEDLAYSKKVVMVLIEEKVPVAIVSVGRPETYTGVLKEAGIKVMHAISTPRHGVKAQEAGVDAVICEGYEAGGHKGFTELTTMVLTPMVVDAVSIPVVTGGGIGDARGVLAALVLGADGIYMGTRFMVTPESESHVNVKEAVVKGEGACTVSVPKDYMLARDLKNSFTSTYLEKHAAGAGSDVLNAYQAEHSQYHAQHLGQADDAELCCGQVAGLISDLKPAGDVMNDLVENISRRFEELKNKVTVFKSL